MNDRIFFICIIIGAVIGVIIWVILFDFIINMFNINGKLDFIYNTLQSNTIECQK